MTQATHERPFIRSCLPHGDGMCLLEQVIDWDDSMIACLTRRTGVADHPLRRDGRVHAVIAAEYAAQATAVHGALRAPHTIPREGRVAGIRNLVWHEPDLAAQLPAGVRCHEQLSQPQAIVYDFELSADETPLVTGQVTVAFPEGPS